MTTIHTTPIAERANVFSAGEAIFVNYPSSGSSGEIIRMHDCGMGPFWWISERRVDSDGGRWTRQLRKCVMDDFGALVEVKQ